MTARVIVRFLLAALFLAAGIVHLLDPHLFLPIMPPAFPFPLFCILASGVAEISGGFGLLVPSPLVQAAAGLGLVLLLLAVFPANIYMAAHHVRIHGFPKHDWEAWARLPLQPLLILAVAWVSWPSKKLQP